MGNIASFITGELFADILKMFAGVGVFLIGLNAMGDGLERASGKGMRKLLNKISNNRFAGVGIGAGVTGIIQSSAATTVMVIGFVNAGLMTLFQATAIIMGANIGTTVTGLLLMLKDLPISGVLGLLTFVGGMMVLLSKKELLKNIGNIMAGLGLIFVGLSLVSDSLSHNEDINRALKTVFTVVSNPFLLIIIGAVFTALIQSSSAATGVIILLVSEGTNGTIMPMQTAFFIILGTNIGTCVTALMASIGTTINARRAALIHLLFNLIGTILFSIILLIFPQQFVNIFQKIFPNQYSMQVAWFHFFFNVTTTCVLVAFIDKLVKLATLIIPDKGYDENTEHLFYLDDRILNTPPIAVAQTIKETINMAQLAELNLDRAIKTILTNDDNLDEIYEKEKQINFINRGISIYLVKISSLALSNKDEELIGSLHHVISDIERIGDHAKNLAEYAAKMDSTHIIFSDEAKSELESMYTVIKIMFRDALFTFDKRDQRVLKQVLANEDRVDKMKAEFSEKHISRLKSGNCTAESGELFFACLADLERIADHLNNIAHSVKIRSAKPQTRPQVYTLNG